MRNRTHTPGAGYTERAEVHRGAGGEVTSTAAQDITIDAAGALVLDGEFSRDVDFAVIGLVIQPPDSPPPPQNILTITTIGSGNVVLDPPGGSYAPGTVVTLTAEAASGWEFADWSGDITDTANPVTMTMDANKNVTANFVGDTHLYAGCRECHSCWFGNRDRLIQMPARYLRNRYGGDPDSNERGVGYGSSSIGAETSSDTANPESQLPWMPTRMVTANFTSRYPTFNAGCRECIAPAGSGTVTLDPPMPAYLRNRYAVVTLTAESGARVWEFVDWSGDIIRYGQS